ncbi:unnamed protein product, partial [marine sediment metagenome]
MGVEPFLLSSTLNLVLAQRLIRRLCEEKEKYKLKETELNNLSKYCDFKKIEEVLRNEKILKEKQALKNIEFYRPKSSKECPEGYRERIG